jgi:hypothetical protein
MEFDCTGSAAPDTSKLPMGWFCNSPFSMNGSNVYCCNSRLQPDMSCGPVSNVDCAATETEVTCTNGSAPMGACRYRGGDTITAAGQSETYIGYCCIDFPSSACTPVNTTAMCNAVECTIPLQTDAVCGGMAFGFSCSGTSTPTDSLASLMCNAANPGDGGASMYCCK